MQGQSITELRSEHNYLALPDSYYSLRQPQALDSPRLVITSESCAQLLDIQSDTLNSAASLLTLSGAEYPSQWQPLAMKYFGHQFGYLNPELGDGRGLLMAQVRNKKGELWDLHLKGAGTTPYSRGGDGRAVLRSSIREFLASEALAALNVATSRALAVVTSDTPVYRETEERGTTLLRVARSHVRFGHFEFAYHSKDRDLLEALARYVVQTHYPCLNANKQGYADMFQLICEASARTLADWQSIGFAHGVMNTDNMSIIGDTFDFGPYGFMDRFRANYICNHSDHEGRYAFDRQPAIAQWNLSALAQALSPLVEHDALTKGLQAYNDTFNHAFLQKMRRKLGLHIAYEEDQALIFEGFQMMQSARLDYSFFFRTLSQEDLTRALATLREHAVDIVSFDAWSRKYQHRIEKEEIETEVRAGAMRAVNPKFVLRNHLAQAAIEAADKGDYSLVNRLHRALTKPFEEQNEFEDFADLPPANSEELEISCSS